MDKLKRLVAEATEIDPQNDVLMEQNRNLRFEEMAQNAEETIAYLDQCSETELLWATEVFEELAERFGNDKFIDCIKRNMRRCEDANVRKQLNDTLNCLQ